NNSKIISWYVTSPLIWGIHTAASSKIESEEDMEGCKYAISRFGSGSHMMALVDAANRGFTIKEDEWKVVDSLNGARKSLKINETDLFFWEKFTTKPFVDEGEFRRIGECPTPWPCFAIMVRDDVLVEHENEIITLLEELQQKAYDLKNYDQAVPLIAERYGLLEEDVAEWLSKTEWATSTEIDVNILDQTQEVLMQVGKLEKKLPFVLLQYELETD
ncbi:MAG: ABC transporter substrate-binding protein, partial [Cyclobacteriaceae bacterium]